jgi:DNA-binding HxlR family transcriptional regulator
MSFDSIKPRCNQLEDKPGCIQAAISVIGDKWTPLLLGQLIEGEKTFGELELQLSGISPRTLSARLTKSEQGGIIKKNQYNDKPPRYKYQLTTKGREFQVILQSMATWGEKYS